MEIKIEPRGPATLVEIRGRIVDGEPAEHLSNALRSLVAESQNNTILDLGEVDWFDSTGIEIVVAHYVSVTKQGGRVVLLKANDRIKHLFKLVRLDDRFGWADDLEAALAWLEKPLK